jgi:hypothetical protein
MNPNNFTHKTNEVLVASHDPEVGLTQLTQALVPDKSDIL